MCRGLEKVFKDCVEFSGRTLDVDSDKQHLGADQMRPVRGKYVAERQG